MLRRYATCGDFPFKTFVHLVNAPSKTKPSGKVTWSSLALWTNPRQARIQSKNSWTLEPHLEPVMFCNNLVRSDAPPGWKVMHSLYNTWSVVSFRAAMISSLIGSGIDPNSMDNALLSVWGQSWTLGSTCGRSLINRSMGPNSSPDQSPPTPRWARQVTHERINDAKPVTYLQVSGIHRQLRQFHIPGISRRIFTESTWVLQVTWTRRQGRWDWRCHNPKPYPLANSLGGEGGGGPGGGRTNGSTTVGTIGSGATLPTTGSGTVWGSTTSCDLGIPGSWKSRTEAYGLCEPEDPFSIPCFSTPGFFDTHPHMQQTLTELFFSFSQTTQSEQLRWVHFDINISPLFHTNFLGRWGIWTRLQTQGANPRQSRRTPESFLDSFTLLSFGVLLQKGFATFPILLEPQHARSPQARHLCRTSHWGPGAHHKRQNPSHWGPEAHFQPWLGYDPPQQLVV